MNRTSQQLAQYLEDASKISYDAEIPRWSNRVATFLSEAMGADAAARFRSLTSLNEYDELALKCGHLEGLLARSDDQPNSQNPILQSQEVPTQPTAYSARKIFVVHGHDGEAKEAVARFIEKLELEPIILHEQPNQGRTVIEKFEVSSTDVAFAVVLLTPDDIGSAANSPDLLARARQNVILELGYFLGRLGRTRVCALHKESIELPSDFDGVIYIPFDPAGAWKTKLAQELVEAKLSIKLEGLIK